MKLSELFGCCLPVRRKKHKNERVDTSKKKLKKEAKHLKKEMAGRRRMEDLRMDISKVQETVVVSLDEVKDGPAVRFEGENAVIAIHHDLIESSANRGTPQMDEGGFSKEDCNPNESSVDHGTAQLDKEDVLNKSTADHGTLQLDAEGGKSSSLLHGDGDGASPVPRLKLDQPRVGKATPQPGVWCTADTPENRDVMEEERRKILQGFFERKGLTTQNATTQATLITEEEKYKNVFSYVLLVVPIIVALLWCFL
ncbi:uncharacterized protein LOC121709699 isoform X2 [Alosa sapidissima]|uniref:uncharacterized protein LOC121709699 isoform X2 n=1 Tax=Alosa sapidissima TaxID=34773 RepID=UPI001C089422|nr:uncharacterized protein LOC121709699 isoform X2 [Alosa sapidissima]